jgi:superoxide reductase
MKLMTENTSDGAKEKHVPVIEKVADGYKVSVGSVLQSHAGQSLYRMDRMIADGQVYQQYLKPGDTPVAVFKVSAANVTAREYCNLHGLWKGTL